MGQPCGRADCPIIDPRSVDRRALRVHTIAGGSEHFRATHRRFDANTFTPAGVGNGRFSSLEGRGHTYVARQRSAALLESVFHEASGPNPRIYRSQLADHQIVRLHVVDPVRVLDLRDPALAELGLERSQLTAANPLHYPCTRSVAERIVGTKGTAGLVWTSRQGSLHAERNRDGLAAEVLRHDSLDVAVLYTPDHSGRIEMIDAEPLMQADEPSRFVVELANLLRIAIL